eukprot:TRINITY_DN91_c0_g1_i1.p1 TRINITY_DN91_c0_g1~~TRINITY_DN91_c0_g1_i1.p1  ORF type:complete len:237 (-),score=44.27 TRINITY_DN91_c0_g1_i1:294-1004(-)
MCIRDRVSTQSTGEVDKTMAARFLVAALLCVSTSALTGGYNIPTGWVSGQDYVLSKTATRDDSTTAGYIWPGPDPSVSTAPAYHSADGFYCEAKHYDTNFGVWATQDCANKWADLVTNAGAKSLGTMAGCQTVVSRPCGCQNICRPLACSLTQVKNTFSTTTPSGTDTCDYEHQCRKQQELGFVTSCATQATFQISMWFGIIFAVVVVFVAYGMMNMSLDMDSLLYSVGDPDKKDN